LPKQNFEGKKELKKKLKADKREKENISNVKIQIRVLL